MAVPQITSNQRTFLVLNTVAMQLITIVQFSIMWDLTQHHNFREKGTWHILLCSLGIGTFMTKGIMIFNEYNIPSIGKNRMEKGKSHAIVLGIGVALLTIGIVLKISDKEDHKYDHFTSNHAKLGLSSWIIGVVTVIGGLLIGLATKNNLLSPVVVKLFHNILGISSYLIGIVSLGYGMKKYLGYNDGTSTSQIVLMSLFTTYALVPPVKSLINQFKSIF